MQKEDLDFFRKWFLNYVDNFSSSDSFIQNNIKMKIEHTGKVCENILLLAKAEKIIREGCRLAETIALFHDLGRFEQFMRYKTFKDSESENHALLGVKILKKKRNSFPHFPKRESSYLKSCRISQSYGNSRMHRKHQRTVFFQRKLIRDADKLDILRIVSESYKEGEKGRESGPRTLSARYDRMLGIYNYGSPSIKGWQKWETSKI